MGEDALREEYEAAGAVLIRELELWEGRYCDLRGRIETLIARFHGDTEPDAAYFTARHLRAALDPALETTPAPGAE